MTTRGDRTRGDQTVIRADVEARLLGLRLLTLHAVVVVDQAPDQPTAVAVSRRAPIADTRSVSRARQRTIARAASSGDSGAGDLRRAESLLALSVQTLAGARADNGRGASSRRLD